MNSYIVVAVVVAFAIGPIHSVLGEKLILKPILRSGDLPQVFGSEVFTKRTLRFFWHLTSIAWSGFAVILVWVAPRWWIDISARNALVIIAWTFLVSAGYAFVASRGKHFSWFLFLAIAVMIWLGIR
jgi:hypothetical protein